MRLIFFALVAILIMIGGGAYYMSLQDDNGEVAITPTESVMPTVVSTPTSSSGGSTIDPTPTPTPTSTDGQTQGSAPTDVGSLHTAPELGTILKNPTYATLRLENYGEFTSTPSGGGPDFLVAQSNGVELF
ncbi:hypothetical protein COY32_02955, partial [candidate division WWE3 bacterium CG_4_10_14_0_2_um_filter_41_14]